MIDEFLKAVKTASELAKRDGAPLLLLVFCHGLPGYQLLLDDGNRNKGLSITRLKGFIEPGCRVTLVTTACYSGGWAISPDFNSTTLTAAGSDTESNAWIPSGSIGRSCGSIFASTIINTLSSVSSPLLDNSAFGPLPGPAESMETLQPDSPTQLQTESYNQFCRSILEVCGARVHRLWTCLTNSQARSCLLKGLLVLQPSATHRVTCLANSRPGLVAQGITGLAASARSQDYLSCRLTA